MKLLPAGTTCFNLNSLYAAKKLHVGQAFFQIICSLKKTRITIWDLFENNLCLNDILYVMCNVKDINSNHLLNKQNSAKMT